MSATEGWPYVFSAWMKADRDGMRATVEALGFGQEEFTLTRDWKRYIVSGVHNPAPQTTRVGYTQLSVNIEGNGVVWLDAIQLEEGADPTA